MNIKIRKLGITAISCAILVGSVTPVVANAAVVDTGNDNSINDIESIDDVNKLSDRAFLKLVGGFTEEDISHLSSSEVSELSNQAKLKMNDPYKAEIGYSSIAKGVLKAWKKLPSGIKRKIARYTGIGGLLKAVDHFTGTEEHVIYSALRYCHVPSSLAHIATKVITLFI